MPHSSSFQIRMMYQHTLVVIILRMASHEILESHLKPSLTQQRNKFERKKKNNVIPHPWSIWSNVPFILQNSVCKDDHYIDNRSRNKHRNLWVGRCVSMTLVPVQRLCVNIYICLCIPYINSVIWHIYIYIYIYNGSVVQFWRSCTPSRSIGLYLGGVHGSWAECHFLFSLVYQLCLALW